VQHALGIVLGVVITFLGWWLSRRAAAASA